MDLIEIFKALSDENRIRILNLLMHKELCVCEIEAVLKLTQSNASRHLNKLKAVGLIASSKNAQWVYYKVSDYLVVQNELLYQYLRSEIKHSPMYMKDLEHLMSNYTESDSCSNK